VISVTASAYVSATACLQTQNKFKKFQVVLKIAARAVFARYAEPP